MLVVLGEVIGNARDARVHVGAAEFFRRHDLASRGLHERRSRQENRPARDDHRFVGHRRNVRAARRARTHHRGDLRYSLARHARLVEKNTPEMVAVGKNLVLLRQERAARIDQVYTSEVILLGDLLRAQMLLDRQRVVRAAFDGRVVCDHDAAPAFDRCDPSHQPGRGRRIFVNAVPCKRREFEERFQRICQAVDPFARGHLSAFAVTLGRFCAAAFPNAR